MRPIRGAAAGLGLALLLMPACRADRIVAPTGDDDVFWTLSLDHQALTLALAPSLETFQLTATPLNSSGEPMDALPAPTFTTTNVNTVQVSSTGLLTARAPTANTTVVATLTWGGVTHADTATVAVTPDPAGVTLGTLSIHPVAPDSAKFALGGTILEPSRTLVPMVLDQHGAPIAGLPVRYESLDPTVLQIDPWSGTITGLSLGTAPIVATVTAWGVTKADTVPFTIGYPALVDIDISSARFGYPAGSFLPERVTIGVGGIVVWKHGLGAGFNVDIIFDDPTYVGAVPEFEGCVLYGAPCDPGNVPAFGYIDPLKDFDEYLRNSTRARRFNAPGTYHFRSTVFGTEGTLIVVDESGS